jgi:hypothetical protein
MSAGTEQRPERRWEIEEEQGEDGRHVLYYRWPAETAEEADGGANRQDPHDPAERSPMADADV